MSEDTRTQRRWIAPLVLGAALLLFATWLQAPLNGAQLKSDDYPTIEYASELESVLHDFTGPQWGSRLLQFYRPIVTSTFYLQGLAFPAEPGPYLWANFVFFLCAALLLFALLRSLAPGRRGTTFSFLVALLWIANPIHVFVMSWAVGRTSGLYFPLLLAGLLFHVRHRRGGKAWPVWIFAALALGTKEPAFAFPLYALAIDLLDPKDAVRGVVLPLGRRPRLPALPLLLLIPVGLALRYLALGQLAGGYLFFEVGTASPELYLRGIWRIARASFFPSLPGVLAALTSAVLLALALGWLLTGTRRVARALGVLLLVAAWFGPFVQLLPVVAAEGPAQYGHASNLCLVLPWIAASIWGVPKLLSLAKLGEAPFASVAGIVVAVLPLFWLWPALEAKRDVMAEHDASIRSIRTSVSAADAALAGTDWPVLVDGDTAHVKLPQRFNWGLGCLLSPPFHSSGREVSLQLPPAHGARSPGASWFRSHLPGYVRVADDRAEWIELGPGKSYESAQPVGFSGRLDREFLDAIFEGRRMGYRVGPSFGGEVAVLTSFHSCVVPVASLDGVLPLPALLLGNVKVDPEKDKDPTRPLPLSSPLMDSWDLMRERPVLLFWWEGAQLVGVRLHCDEGFAELMWQRRQR